MQTSNPSSNKTLKSDPYAVNSSLTLPSAYNFRRHFTPEGRFFYRVHGQGHPSFTRTDSMNGDVLIYNPIDDVEHQQIHQLHYFKPTDDNHGVLVFINRLSELHREKIFIGLIKVCHKTQTYTVLSKAEFRNYDAETVCQGTLLQNWQDFRQMACIFIESVQGQNDRSCITFFEIINGQIRITKNIFFKTSVYFARWNGQFLYGLFEEEDGASHSIYRYNFQNDTFYCLKENILSVLSPGDYASDFCWYLNDIYIFMMTEGQARVYIQKFSLIDLKITRIDLQPADWFSITRASRFFINLEGIICYCETSDDGEVQTDRFIRIPMRRPESLLNKSWILTRELCEKQKKSFQLPETFEYLSPIRKLFQFEKPSVSNEEIDVDEVNTSDLGQSIDEDMEEKQAGTASNFLSGFTNEFFSDE